MNAEQKKDISSTTPENSGNTGESSQNKKHTANLSSQFLPVGRWVSRPRSNDGNQNYVLQNRTTVQRTGTDLVNEESDIGATRNRTLPRNDIRVDNEVATRDQPNESAHVENSAMPSDQHMALIPDYYRYEWFRILIGLIIVMASEIIITVLVRISPDLSISLTTGRVVDSVISIYQMAFFALEAILLYTVIFVTLRQHHRSLGAFFRNYCKLSYPVQRGSLRFLAYAYPCTTCALLLWKALGNRILTFTINIDYFPIFP